MAEVRRNLILEFETTAGSKLELKILKPAEGLDALDIKDAMDAVITTGALGSQSQANKVVGARYDIRQIEEVTLA